MPALNSLSLSVYSHDQQHPVSSTIGLKSLALKQTASLGRKGCSPYKDINQAGVKLQPTGWKSGKDSHQSSVLGYIQLFLLILAVNCLFFWFGGGLLFLFLYVSLKQSPKCTTHIKHVRLPSCHESNTLGRNLGPGLGHYFPKDDNQACLLPRVG